MPMTVPDQVAAVPSRGIRLHYGLYGDPDADVKVLLVMGIFTPADEWGLVVQELLALQPRLQVSEQTSECAWRGVIVSLNGCAL